jgi:hypothetical protein
MLRNNAEITNKQQALEQSVFLGKLRNAIWLLGVSSWLFGITDRSIASLSDGYLSALDIVQLSHSFLFLCQLAVLEACKASRTERIIFQETKKVSLKQPTAKDQEMIERVLVEAREAIANGKIGVGALPPMP